ncbi:MAG: OmpA family protein [Phyllobacteriaceae bacterium]|nr:OmpA family protein [Phyllobacteriaceae bacterium]
MFRKSIAAALASSFLYAAVPATAQQMPSANRIEQQLQAKPRIRLDEDERVTIKELKRRPELRRAAPSIDIQAINFAYDSAAIPGSQYDKVETIAFALERLLNRRPDAVVLIEGHTDAVGSRTYNYGLSDARARSLKRLLARDYGIPPSAMETVGFGEDYLLVPTSEENWRNRRVTLRRVDDFLR